MPDEDEEENFKQVASLQSAQKTLKIAQRILHPYSIEYKYCDWCTVYTVGQRVSNHFSYKDRLFLAGDAIHTHTPKGGQGANVSQQDTYNLGWKLAGVLSGQLAPSILSTYEEERRPVAQELIELDLALADIFTGKSLASKEGVKSVYERNRKHGNGDICYTSNVLIAAPDECDASRATGLRLGQRIPNADIVNQASGCLSSVHARLKSNGQWRVLVFPGSLADESRLQQTNATGEELASILARLPSAKSNGVASKANTLEVTLIHAGTPDSVEASALHSIYFPSDERSGYDYNTVFAAAPPMAGAKMRSVYDLFGIAEDAGALVVVRPDQVVAWIGGAADLDSMRSWLYRFMVLGGET
jgi:phenol 2-monooxygenase